VAPRASITVRLLGQDYRVTSDGDATSQEQVQAAAAVVDETMRRLRERTGTVDTLHVAVLAALNVAHRYITQREAGGGRLAPGEALDPERMRALIELVESAASEAPGIS
jgi:cell division protein ZapA (FtsZ GTPase activity inhibitor)